HMFEPLIQYSECEEGSYYLDIDFDSEGMRSDSFGVDFDWTPYQRFSYADLPIRIGPFTSDDWTDHYLLFYDLANHDCCTQMTIEGQTCPAILEITDAVVGECREDGSFPVSLSYEGYGFLKVDVYQGYEYLCTYDVHENPLVLDSLYATDPKVEIKLCPSGVEAECDVWTVEVPEACVGIPCGFDALTYEVSDCDSGFFYLHLIVDPAENSGEHFVVEGPFDYREELAFSDSVHVLGPFPSGEKFYEFHVGDPLNGDCYAPLTVGRVICPDQCDIVLGSVSALCVESGKVILLIDSISSLHSGYDLYINGEALGFFKASSFPLEKTIEVHEMDSIHVNICVSDNLTCCATTMVALEPCVSTCPIKELVLDTTECNNGMFSIIVDAELEEVDDTGRFQLAVMDSLWGVYNYAELPLTIGPFAADGKTKYRVVLEDLGVESCKVDGRLDAIVCTGPSAPAGDQIVVLRCQGLEQYVRIPAMLEEPTVMHLFNSNGLVIDQRNIASSTKYVVLNLDRPPSGLYVLRLRSAQGLVSRKVIIP
nr:T9SS type A sorting domain-containing protein [Saprospiraceae bacterium]